MGQLIKRGTPYTPPTPPHRCEIYTPALGWYDSPKTVEVEKKYHVGDLWACDCGRVHELRRINGRGLVGEYYDWVKLSKRKSKRLMLKYGPYDTLTEYTHQQPTNLTK